MSGLLLVEGREVALEARPGAGRAEAKLVPGAAASRPLVG